MASEEADCRDFDPLEQQLDQRERARFRVGAHITSLTRRVQVKARQTDDSEQVKEGSNNEGLCAIDSKIRVNVVGDDGFGWGPDKSVAR